MAVHVDASVPIHRLSVEEYFRMFEAGILYEDDRVELLRGVIVEKSTPTPEHQDPIEWLNMRLVPWAIDNGYSIRPQLTLVFELQDSVPQPDFAVVPRRPRTHAHPVIADLIIEVSVSSLRVDLGLKAGIYAEAGVPEYWVVDAPQRRVVVHDDPRDGEYTRVTLLSDGDALEPAALPNFPPLAVTDVFDGDLG